MFNSPIMDKSHIAKGKKKKPSSDKDKPKEDKTNGKQKDKS